MSPSSNHRKPGLAIVATAVTLVVVFALFSASWSNAQTVSLEVHYTVSEKLTYNLTSVYTNRNGNETTTTHITQSTLKIEVLYIGPDSYLLNYTVTPNTPQGSTTSQALEVNHADAINLFTLMPVALLQYTQSINCSSPIETAMLSQNEARLGEAIQVPVICSVTGTPDAKITLKFLEAETLEIEAGNFRVFRIELTQLPQSYASSEEEYAGFLGWAFLEQGSGKQIKSMLQFNMTTAVDSAVTTFESTLIKTES